MGGAARKIKRAIRGPSETATPITSASNRDGDGLTDESEINDKYKIVPRGGGGSGAQAGGITKALSGSI